jgi:hypothetical protein
MRDPAVLDATRDALQAALAGPDLAPLWAAWRNRDPHLVEARCLVPGVRTYSAVIARMASLKGALEQRGLPVTGGAFERLLIVAAAADAIAAVPALPVDARVQELVCQNFQTYAVGRGPEPFDLSRASFVAMARIATLSRFPAGQLDWEVSGIPRSWLLKVPVRVLPRLATSIAFELRGFGPAYFSHLNPNRRNQGILLERESLRSYHRMARSMERQPHVRGLITASWLHSPDTFLVSPHLAWLNRVFLENGGRVLPLGPVAADCGVLHRSPERQKAYDEGTFRPTQALVIWPRAAMLSWARGHDELRDDRSTAAPETPLPLQAARA